MTDRMWVGHYNTLYCDCHLEHISYVAELIAIGLHDTLCLKKTRHQTLAHNFTKY